MLIGSQGFPVHASRYSPRNHVFYPLIIVKPMKNMIKIMIHLFKIVIVQFATLNNQMVISGDIALIIK
jgi:hypothetical protein